jgi:hypothetical protein
VSVDWYNGEAVDNMRSASLDAWDTPTYNEAAAGGWSGALPPYDRLDDRALQPPPLEPVTRVATIAPVTFFSPADGLPSGTYSWSFDQNFAGCAYFAGRRRGTAMRARANTSSHLRSPSFPPTHRPHRASQTSSLTCLHSALPTRR